MTGTTYDRLEYLKETKRQIKEAIIDKGQTISDSDPFRSYVAKIEAIETGTPINNQNKSITSDGSYTADQGYTGLGTVTVTAGVVAAQEVENEMSERLMLINDGEVELTVTVSPTDANLTITSVANSVDITPTSSSSGVYTFDISSFSTRSYTYSASATGYITATGTIAGGTTTSTITLVAENNPLAGEVDGPTP